MIVIVAEMTGFGTGLKRYFYSSNKSVSSSVAEMTGFGTGLKLVQV